MGFSEAGSANCRRHPNHKQSPGVCSSCLRDKLSKLSISPPSFNSKKPYIISHSSSISSTPPYSSSASSTNTATRHRRNGSESYVSVGMVLNNGLKKSRSVSCAPLTSSSSSSRSKLGPNNNDVINEKLKNCVNGAAGEVDNNNNNNNTKKKNGFLKKLIHSTSKKTKGVLMHSKTMRERTHPFTHTNTNTTNKN